MKKTVASLLILIIVLGVLSVPVAGTESGADQAVTNGCHSVDGQKALLSEVSLSTEVGSVFLYEVNSETVIYSQNPDQRVYPASIVKIMTALIAIEQGTLTDSVTVTEAALASVPYGAVVSELEAGEILTLEDLLHCMLVISGNDAAIVIAEHISGTQQAFVDQMNQYAQELGCTGTNFTNVHGLHDENQYTTARDVTRILSRAIQNEQFCKVFGAVSYTVPQTEHSIERELITTNYLMRESYSDSCYDSRVTGSRSGVTETGTRCIASVAQSGELCLISVLMDAKADSNEAVCKDTKKLLDAGFEGNEKIQLLYAGQVLKQASVTNGDCLVSLGTDVDIFSVLPENVTLEDLEITYADFSGQLTAPVEKGQEISYVQFMYNGMCVAQSKLVAMNSVRSTLEKEVSFAVVDQEEAKKETPIWVWILVIAAVVVAVAVYCLIKLRLHRNAEKMLGMDKAKRTKRR